MDIKSLHNPHIICSLISKGLLRGAASRMGHMKIPASPSKTPVVVTCIMPYKTPLKEFRP